jgi:hypothetical protein
MSLISSFDAILNPTGKGSSKWTVNLKSLLSGPLSIHTMEASSIDSLLLYLI